MTTYRGDVIRGLLREGLSITQIATRLGIAKSTAERWRYRIEVIDWQHRECYESRQCKRCLHDYLYPFYGGPIICHDCKWGDT